MSQRQRVKTLSRAAMAVVVATIVVTAVAVAATPHTGRFTGATTGQGKTIKLVQDRSVRFRVGSGGTKIRGLTVGFKANCPSGTIESDHTAISGTFAVKGGRFSGTGHIDGGGTAAVKGRFTTPRKANGTLRMRPVVSDLGVESMPPERCDSGTLKWSAHLG